MYHSIKDQTKELEARSERKKGQRKTNFLYMTHDQTGKKIKAAKNKERFTTSLKLRYNKQNSNLVETFILFSHLS